MRHAIKTFGVRLGEVNLLGFGFARFVGYAVVSIAVAICCICANRIVLLSISLGEPAASMATRVSLFGSDGFIMGVLLFLLFFVSLIAADIHLRSVGDDRPTTNTSRMSVRRAIVAVSLIMIIAWVPYAFILYPGVYYDDTVFQLAQLFGTENLDVYTGAPNPDVPKLTDHHPVFTTLIYGFFSYLGKACFGAEYTGLFLLCIIQALCIIFALSGAIVYANRTLCISRKVTVLLVLLTALNPLIAIYSFSVVKDSLFVAPFVVFSTLYVELMRTRGGLLEQRSAIVLLVLASIGMVLFKKVSIYLVLICVILAVVRCRHGRAALIGTGVLNALMVFVFIPMFVFPAIGAAAGSYREMMSVPFQQTALFVRECSPSYEEGGLSDAEIKVIDDMLGISSLSERYYLTTADYVKNPAPLSGSRLSYAKVYFEEGIRRPFLYAKAWFALNAGFFASNDIFYPRIASVHYKYLDEASAANSMAFYPETTPDIKDEQNVMAFVAAIANIPGIGLLMTKALWAFVLPAFVVTITLSRRRWALWSLAPYIVFVLFLYLGPLSTDYNSGRYVLPLVCLLPIVLGCVFGQYNSFAECQCDDLRSSC